MRRSIYTNPENPDCNGDGLNDSEEVIPVIERRRYYPVGTPDEAVSYKYYFEFRSDPTKVDSDGDGVSDDIDIEPLNWGYNECFIYHINQVEKCALNYKKGEKNYDCSEETWLITMFIRQFNSNYVGGNWNAVAGAIDQNFVNYVKINCPASYQYFLQTTKINSKHGTCDLYHWAATLSALTYKSSFDDGFQSGIMDEYYIDNLSGWAGDLQTLIADYINVYGYNENNYDIICHNMKTMMDNSSYSFSFDDLNADIDAYNIYCRFDNSLTKSLNKYYNEIDNPYTFFKDYLERKMALRTYRLHNYNPDELDYQILYYGILEFTVQNYIIIKWPLYTKYHVNVSEIIAEAGAKTFYDTIMEGVNNEM